MTPLAQLRLRLTLWYAGVFTLILGLLGIGLFVAVRHQMSRQLDLSLEGATAAVMRAARIREAERAPQGAVVDAVEELHVPDRALYLFDDRERSMDQMRRFMADAAHELRAPVTILRTRAEVALGQSRDSARDAVAFQAIEREATRLGQVVGDLLTLARADAGERPIAQVPLYLDDVAAEAVEAVRTLAEQKHVQLEAGRVQECEITGDPTLIRQLLLIVLDNAIKFTAAGRPGRPGGSAEGGPGAARGAG